MGCLIWPWPCDEEEEEWVIAWEPGLGPEPMPEPGAVPERGLEVCTKAGLASTRDMEKSNEGEPTGPWLMVVTPAPNPNPGPLAVPAKDTGTGARARERRSSRGTDGGQGLGWPVSGCESPRSGSRTRARWSRSHQRRMVREKGWYTKEGGGKRGYMVSVLSVD